RYPLSPEPTNDVLRFRLASRRFRERSVGRQASSEKCAPLQGAMAWTVIALARRREVAVPLLQSALNAGFGDTGTTPQKRRQIGINKGRVINLCQIRRVLKTRKNSVGNLASWYAFLTVARRDVARPVTHILPVRAILHAEENRGVAMLVSSYLPRPENFHEIPWLRLIKVIEVLPKLQFVKKTG